MPKETSRGDRLGENDADRDEDRAGSRRIGNCDFEPRAFRVMVPAAETESTFGQILANGDLLLKASPAYAREDSGFNARAIPAGYDTLFDRAARRQHFIACGRLRFDPD